MASDVHMPKNGSSASSVMKNISWVTPLETGEMIGNVTIHVGFIFISLTIPDNTILVGCNGATGWIIQ